MADHHRQRDNIDHHPTALAGPNNTWLVAYLNQNRWRPKVVTIADGIIFPRRPGGQAATGASPSRAGQLAVAQRGGRRPYLSGDHPDRVSG